MASQANLFYGEAADEWDAILQSCNGGLCVIQIVINMDAKCERYNVIALAVKT